MQLHAPLIMWKKNGNIKFLAQNINFSRVHNTASQQRLNYVDKLNIAMLNDRKYRYAPLQFEGSGNDLTAKALISNMN